MLNNLKRRALTLLLSLAMIITYMPTSMIAYAVDGDEDQVQVEQQVDADKPAEEAASEEAAPEEISSEEVKPEDVASKEAAEPAEESSEEVAQPADDGTKADADAKAEDEVKDEFSKGELKDSNGRYEVAVSYGADAEIPEGAKLVLKEFAEGDKEFKEAKKALVADKDGNSVFAQTTEKEQEELGMAAFDLTIYDKDGKVVEPKSEVAVSFKLKELPEGADAEAIAASMEMQHLNESSGNVVVEKIATVDGQEAAKAKEIGEIAVDENKETAQVETVVDAFSTFTITWSGRTVTVHYVDTNGVELPIENPTTTIGATTNALAYLIYDIDGYVYDHTYLNNDNNRIAPLLRYNSNQWRYGSTTSTSPNTVLNNNDHIYVVYDKKPATEEGGSPELDPQETWPAGDGAPHFSKSSINNGNGTNTISLSIKAAEKPVESATPADVIVVFDRSYSMQYYNMNKRQASSNAERRLTIAKNAVNNMANILLNGDNHDVRMAVVTFGTDAQLRLGFTNNYNTFSNSVNNISSSANPMERTNWEKGLRIADQLEVRDDAATFVVFVTDGDPTVRESRGDFTNAELSSNNHGMMNDFYVNYHVFGSGSDTTNSPNINDCYEPAVPQAASIIGNNKNFYAVGVSSDVSRLKRLMSESGGSEDKAFICTDETAMEEAFSSITEAIKSILGFGNVQFTDGITSLTKTEMKVQQSVGDFKYYRSGGTYGEKTEWTTRERDGCAPATYNASTGAVEWNMGQNFQLENGVTYIVEFTAWPSQEAYDLIADLNNGLRYYEEGHGDKSISDAERAQVEVVTPPSGDDVGEYALKTNTDTLNATYNKTTETGGTVTISDNTDIDATYVPGTIQNMDLDSDYITIEKEWENELDERTVDAIDLTVTKDKAAYLDVNLSWDPDHPDPEHDWKSGKEYISTGFITHTTGNNYRVREPGHDYTVTEPEEFWWNWELTADIYRPMVIDGKMKVLIKTSSPTGTEGVDFYVINGSRYQVREGAVNLLATNHRRSFLDLKKEVLAPNPDVNGLFTYTNTVTTSTGEDVWFSVQDGDGVTVEFPETSSNVTEEIKDGSPTGYYYVPSGEEFWFQIKADWNVRFTNLPSGSTYNFRESEMSDGFEFDSIRTSTKNGGRPGTYTGTTTTGTIDKPNNEYFVTYTNKGIGNTDIVHPTKLTLKKIDATSDTGKGLEGAIFTLSGGSMTGSQDYTTGSDGTVEIPFDADGTYTLTEKQAPDDYVTPTPALSYTIEVEKELVEVKLSTDKSVWEWIYDLIFGDNTQDIDGFEKTENPDGTITYTLTVPNTPETDSVVAKKIWDDNNDAAGVRPGSVVFRLYVQEEGEEATPTDYTVTLRGTPTSTVPEEGGYESAAWTATFVNLPKVKDGKDLTYTVREMNGNTAVENNGVLPGKEGTGAEYTASYSSDSLTITNKLTTTPATINVTKLLVDENDNPIEWDDEDEFTFTLAPNANEPMPAAAGTTVTVDKEHPTGSFGEITYVAAADYTYKITETKGDKDGVTYDTSDHEIVVKVTRNPRTHALTAEVGYPEGKSSVEIKNVFKPATAEPEVTKEIEDWGTATSFTFVLEPKANEPMPDGTVDGKKTITINKTDEGLKKGFGSIKYEEAGTYNYTITEVNDGVDGVTYDTTPKNVVVTVSKNETTNVLSTSIKYEGADSLTITNTFTPAKAEPKATKAIEDWGTATSFTFVLEPVADAPMPAGSTTAEGKTSKSVTVTKGGSLEAAFGEISYNKAGTYNYTITEVNDGVDGVTYDTAPHNVVVTVSKNATTNALTASVKYDGENSLTITNTFTPAKVNPEVTKQINDWGTAESFTFELAPKANEPMPEGTADGKKTITINKTDESLTKAFGEIAFNKEGTYNYTITEVDDGVPGVTYDTTPKNVVVTVTKDENTNALTASIKYDGANSLTITNHFSSVKASIQATKAMVDPEGNTTDDWGEAESFTFDIEAKSGAPATPESSVTVTKAAPTGNFGEVEYKAVGEYTYEITEEAGTADGVTYDTTPHTVVVTVGLKDGTRDLEVKSIKYDGEDSLTIENTLTPVKAEPKATKEIEDWGTATSFTFVLEPKANEPMPAGSTTAEGKTSKSVTVTKGGSLEAAFGEISYKKAGTYNYTITEVNDGVDGVTYDTTPKNVVVTVSKNATTNALTASIKYDGADSLTITNTFAPGTANLNVTKALTGRDWLDADEFEFTLEPVDDAPMPAADGLIDQIIDALTGSTGKTVKVTKDQKTADFGTISYESAGEYQYTITEVVPDDAVDNVKDGITYDPTPHNVTVTVVKNPQTNALTATVTYEDEAEGAESVTITNDYHATGSVDFDALKILTGRELKAGEFSFELYDPDEKVIQTKQNDADGNVAFDAISFDETVLIDEDGSFLEEKQFTYTIKEVKPENPLGGVTYDQTPDTVTITITDNGDGTLEIVKDTEQGKPDGEFDNTYEATGDLDFNGLKTLRNGDLTKKSFEVELVQIEKKFIFFEDEVPVETVTVPAKAEDVTVEGDDSSAVFNFTTITYTLEDVGEHTYIIREVVPADAVNRDGVKYSAATDAQKAAGGFEYDGVRYDSHEQKIVVTVEDNGDGTLDIVKDPTPAADDYDISLLNSIPTPPTKDVHNVTTSQQKIDGKPVAGGDVLKYEITYTNTTGEDVTATIKDAIPAHTSYDDGSADATGGVYDEETGVITWSMPVADGDSVTVSFQVIVDPEVSGETIVNDAEVDDGTNKYTTNEVSNPTPPTKDVFYPEDLKTSIDKQEVDPNDTLTYVITFKNTKTKEVDVTITDKIPNYTTYVDGSADKGGSYDDTVTPPMITWNVKAPAAKDDGTPGLLTVSFQVKVDDNAGRQTLVNTGTLREGEHGPEMETNPVKNPVTTKLIITKDLRNFVQHEGKDVKATFAFKITGDSELRGDYVNVVAMDFEGIKVKELTVEGMPSDIENINVEEIVSGNYTPSDTGVNFDEEDGKWKVTFENRFKDTDYKSGAINNYKRNDDGTYSKNGTGDKKSKEPNSTSTNQEGGPGDEPGNN